MVTFAGKKKTTVRAAAGAPLDMRQIEHDLIVKKLTQEKSLLLDKRLSAGGTERMLSSTTPLTPASCSGHGLHPRDLFGTLSYGLPASATSEFAGGLTGFNYEQENGPLTE